MKNKLAWILILGGLAIAAIAWFGSKSVNKKSDAEIIRDAMLEQQAEQQQAVEDAAVLSQKVLSAPESCTGKTTAFIYAICDKEPYADEPWPEWTDTASTDEQMCILDTFHVTNAHAFAIQRKTYDMATPSNGRVSRFISDLCSASLWTDGIDYGDTDKSAKDLINGYFADRATSRVKPGHDY